MKRLSKLEKIVFDRYRSKVRGAEPYLTREMRDALIEGTVDDKGKPFKNLGVYASTTLLPEKLAKAQAEFGHLSDAQLHSHKKVHGCATAF